MMRTDFYDRMLRQNRDAKLPHVVIDLSLSSARAFLLPLPPVAEISRYVPGRNGSVRLLPSARRPAPDGRRESVMPKSRKRGDRRGL
eukprot:CAMPEP_0181081370 /NCGR_PEP_ID=MMETSP1071-20121207/3066_1 /TAXON_ID=35127 /ORGANISM="Thalassiosira sp., Strain NH16" /LENGTH=86 /DNA_ID=CAMNT_0023162913 /DNA_START=296 /DNA_END=553 /DNA_ORIENTATION=-